MIDSEQLTGQRFGRWTVGERAMNGASGRARWNCQCVCGTTRIVLAKHLRSGKSLSCGCALKSEFGQGAPADAALRRERTIQEIALKLAELSALVAGLAR